METLSKSQAYKIMKENDYVIFREYNGSTAAYNCKIINFKRFKKYENDNTKLIFISYNSCSFMEYISRKIPFLTIND